MSEFYSAKSLADHAGLTPSRVAALCREGEIPATKHGNVWLIAEADAEAWLRDLSVRAATGANWQLAAWGRERRERLAREAAERDAEQPSDEGEPQTTETETVQESQQQG